MRESFAPLLLMFAAVINAGCGGPDLTPAKETNEVPADTIKKGMDESYEKMPPEMRANMPKPPTPPTGAN
jgi:hypothetical protein